MTVVVELKSGQLKSSNEGGAELPAMGTLGLFRERTLRLSEYALRFALMDCAIVIGTALLAKVFYLETWLDTQSSTIPYLGVACAVAILAYLFFEQLGLYEGAALAGPVVGLSRVWGGLSLASLTTLGFFYLLKISDVFSRGWMLTWFASCAIALLVSRSLLTRKLQARIAAGQVRQHVALFGARDEIEKLAGNLKSEAGVFDVVALFEDEAVDKDPRVGAALVQALEGNEFDSIIVAYPQAAGAKIETAIRRLAPYSTELLLCTDFAKSRANIRGSRIVGNLQLGLVDPTPGSQRARFLKSGMDFVFAVAALVVLAPLLVVIAAAIKLDSAGPIFFRQDRYGHNNRVFSIFKFRTMTVMENGPDVKQATRNDPRVTTVGRWLRRASLDELPQLFNVLLGQMSLVGPRPHAIAHDQAFELQIDTFVRRRRVRPGMTGWAQVNGLRGEMRNPEDVRKRMEFDQFYVDNWSIWLDLEIMARTALVLLHDAY
jgi:polysaccharide biosynthesis protein PslA